MRLIFLCLVAAPTFAKTITIAATDDYTKMEAAVAGDEVVIAPGTYKFRVDWETSGTAQNPITVHAQDPNNRPIWDLNGTPVGMAPGSYTAGDKGRGCWQFHGGYYRVDGIIFRNCVDHGSAGIRVINVPSVEVRHTLFQNNTNGMTGAGDGTVIEDCEFDSNGKALAGDQPAHQIYIFGGTLTVRGSYFHDSPLGQNFHVRARDATLEYNFFTRPGSYMGDLMTCEYLCGGSGTAGITQKMLLRGNVIEQSMPANHSQLIALLNDEPTGNADSTGQVDHMDITLLYNTIIGQPGVINSVVHHLNDSGISTAAHLSDNVVTNFKSLNEIASTTLPYSVDGDNNWVTTGSDATMLTGTLSGADPMLDASYLPLSGSPVIGKAKALGAQAPSLEYLATASTQARASANDVGAYESGTIAPDLSSGAADLAGVDLAGADLAGVDLAGIDLAVLHGDRVQAKDGCGCNLGGAPQVSGWWILFLIYLARARWRSPEKVCASTMPSPLP
jgi:hypothetical protein